VGPRPSKGSARRQTISRNDRRRAAVEQRREAVRRQARREAQRRRRRRIGIPLAVALVLLAGAGAFALVERGGGGSTPDYALTSALAPSSDTPFTISTTPAAYHVVYKVDTAKSGESGQDTTTQEYTVRRPFDAHLVAKSGAPPGTDEQWSLAWSMGKYSQTTSGSAPEVGQTAPQAALGDIRLDATLADLVADGKFVAKERRVVLGRDCQVYRTGSALETLNVTAPTKTDYADACIDSSGLMLEEVVVSSGQLAERLIATSVDDQTVPGDDAFTITGDPTPLAQGGSQLTPIDAATPPAEGYWSLPTPPAGYTLQGRYQLLTPADQNSSSDPSASTTTTSTTAPPAPVPSYVDVYVNGPNTIIVRQGPIAGEPQDGGTGTTVDVGNLGSAPLSASLTGSRLLARPAVPAAWYVELQGTVARDALKQVASQFTN
jgi:hypothetical protein